MRALRVGCEDDRGGVARRQRCGLAHDRRSDDILDLHLRARCAKGLHAGGAPPDFSCITSYCALAAAAEFPLGESKERVLILPCPDEMLELQAAIEGHDIVVLMKIGERLPAVLGMLREMCIAKYCAFGRHVGMIDQLIHAHLDQIEPEESLGYLTTMLIRKKLCEKRHAGVQT